MAVRTLVAGYGAAALGMLRETVSDLKSADPMTPVTVLAPNHLAGISARRYLAQGVAGKAGVAGIEVTTLARLAERIAAPTLAPRRPISRAVLAAAWRRALADEPGIFAGIAEHPATVRALAETHDELRDITDAARQTVGATSEVTGQAVRLFERVVRDLERNFYDATDVLLAASTNASSVGPAILYLPQALTNAQSAFVSALAEHSDLTVIAGLTGVQRADAAVHRSLETLGGEAITTGEIPRAHHVLDASDSDDEVRCVVRDLMQTLETTPANRVAVLYAKRTPYARLIHERLQEARLAFNGPGSHAMDERAIPRALLALLGLLDRNISRSDLFGTLSTAPLRAFDGGRIPVSRWERLSREAGVVSGDDWTNRIDMYIVDQERARAEEAASDDPQDWAIERRERNISTAQDLQRFSLRLRSELELAERMATWSDLAQWCRDLVHTLVGSLDDLRKLPANEQYGAADLLTTLDGMASLDPLEPVANLRLLRDVLESELAASQERVGRFGEGVFVAPLSSAIGLDVDTVYVLGLSEDVYPGRIRVDALLPDIARDASGGELRSSRDRLYDGYRQLLAAFASGSQRVVASFPRGDLRRSTHRIPSRWLLPSLRELAGDKTLPATEWQSGDFGDAVSTSGSFAGELLRTAAAATEQEWRIKTVAANHPLDDATSAMAFELVDARRSSALTRFDGNLTGLDGLPDYATSGKAISPTALESYASCPHAFFIQRLLRVQPIEQPEEIVVITPWDIGNLIHESLDELVRSSTDDLPGYGEPWSDEHRARLRHVAYARADAFAQRGLTGHPRLWAHERDRIMRDVDLMLDADDQWRAERRARVVASELSFGMEGQPPVSVAIDRGEVLMRGSADKVDLGEDGTIFVTDIKTGSRSKFKDIGQDDPIPGGAKLQLPVYGYAARERFGTPDSPVFTSYWFVRREPGRIGLNLTPEVDQIYANTIATLVDSIAQGLFPLRPPETDDFMYTTCQYCNPDDIGYGDNRNRWHDKRTDPLLDELLKTVEPGSAL